MQKLYRSLKRENPKVQQISYEKPADAVVYGVLGENMSETEAQSMIKRFTDYFVDLNDLRVSRIEEIIEVLGGDTPLNRRIAGVLNRILAAIFSEYHMVSLMTLKKAGKRPAKQTLEKLDGISLFAVNYCMLTALEGHAMPLTNKMIEYLKSNNLVDSDAVEGDIEGFLTRQIPAKNAYEFYVLLRHESELPETARQRKTKKKTVSKTKKRVE